MPIYEYKCESCGHQVEILQKISDAPAKTCPDCGKDALKKLVSAAAFKLKGTGWYETDFKNKKPKAEKKAGSSATTSTDKSSSSDSNKETSKAAESTKSTNKATGSE